VENNYTAVQRLLQGATCIGVDHTILRYEACVLAEGILAAEGGSLRWK